MVARHRRGVVERDRRRLREARSLLERAVGHHAREALLLLDDEAELDGRRLVPVLDAVQVGVAVQHLRCRPGVEVLWEWRDWRGSGRIGDLRWDDDGTGSSHLSGVMDRFEGDHPLDVVAELPRQRPHVAVGAELEPPDRPAEVRGLAELIEVALKRRVHSAEGRGCSQTTMWKGRESGSMPVM